MLDLIQLILTTIQYRVYLNAFDDVMNHQSSYMYIIADIIVSIVLHIVSMF